MKKFILLIAVIFIAVICAPANLIASANDGSSVVEEQIDTSSDEQKVVINPMLERAYQRFFVRGYKWFKKMKANIEEIESGCQKKGELLTDILSNLRDVYNQYAVGYNAKSSNFDWAPFEGRSDMPPKVIELLH